MSARLLCVALSLPLCTSQRPYWRHSLTICSPTSCSKGALVRQPCTPLAILHPGAYDFCSFATRAGHSPDCPAQPPIYTASLRCQPEIRRNGVGHHDLLVRPSSYRVPLLRGLPDFLPLTLALDVRPGTVPSKTSSSIQQTRLHMAQLLAAVVVQKQALRRRLRRSSRLSFVRVAWHAPHNALVNSWCPFRPSVATPSYPTITIRSAAAPSRLAIRERTAARDDARLQAMRTKVCQTQATLDSGS